MSNEPKTDLVSTRSTQPTTAPTETGKRPYAAPTLTELGSVRELTLAAQGSVGDGGAGLQPSG